MWGVLTARHGVRGTRIRLSHIWQYLARPFLRSVAMCVAGLKITHYKFSVCIIQL